MDARKTEGRVMSDDRSGDQARALQEGIASGAKAAKDLAEKAQTAATQAGSTIRDAALETTNRAGDAAAKAYRQTSDYVSRSTVEQPLTALLIAGAIGYAAAYLIHRR
jgi:ElaB/YqjD/DUF883 family membrane-anchored ribosome-binding protein